MNRILSSTERKRRQTYRGEVHGQLPFDNKGMDEPPPTAEITAAGQNDGLYSLSKEDIAGKLLPCSNYRSKSAQFLLLSSVHGDARPN